MLSLDNFANSENWANSVPVPEGYADSEFLASFSSTVTILTPFSPQKPNFWSPNHPKWIRTMFTGLVYIIGVKQPIFIQLNNMCYYKLSSNITSQTLNSRTTISSIFKLYIKIIERNPTLTLIQQHQTTSYHNWFLPSSLFASSRFSLLKQVFF